VVRWEKVVETYRHRLKGGKLLHEKKKKHEKFQGGAGTEGVLRKKCVLEGRRGVARVPSQKKGKIR